MVDDVTLVSDINLDTIQGELLVLQEQLTTLTEHLALTNVILLYAMAILASVGVCVLLYSFLRKFF